MMIKRISYIFILIFFLCNSTNAQQILETTHKIFNWGGKIGVNSVFPIINSLSIDGIQMQDIQQKYKVGYQGTLFMRVNFDKVFIEPSLMWLHTENEISFSNPSSTTLTNTTSATNYIDNSNNIIEMPVMVGYYLVRENPYALTISAGPTMKYTCRTTFSTHLVDISREYKSENTPLGIGIAVGLGASIGKLFLHFNYEFGLNEVDTDFKPTNTQYSGTNSLVLEKRTNMLSFSLGFML